MPVNRTVDRRRRHITINRTNPRPYPAPPLVNMPLIPRPVRNRRVHQRRRTRRQRVRPAPVEHRYNLRPRSGQLAAAARAGENHDMAMSEPTDPTTDSSNTNNTQNTAQSQNTGAMNPNAMDTTTVPQNSEDGSIPSDSTTPETSPLQIHSPSADSNRSSPSSISYTEGDMAYGGEGDERESWIHGRCSFDEERREGV